LAEARQRKIYLVRHAEPERADVLLGSTNLPLSSGGRVQASHRLRELSAEIIYSSPLRRALETAARIPLLRPFEVIEELAEISYGAWDGKPWSDIEARYPDLARRKLEDWYGVTPPGGETYEDFRERVTHALSIVLNGPLPAIVVAHAAVNAEIARQLTGQDPAAFHMNYCEIREIEL
jgi:broad specificity phosphatase PhoE